MEFYPKGDKGNIRILSYRKIRGDEIGVADTRDFSKPSRPTEEHETGRDEAKWYDQDLLNIDDKISKRYSTSLLLGLDNSSSTETLPTESDTSSICTLSRIREDDEMSYTSVKETDRFGFIMDVVCETSVKSSDATLPVNVVRNRERKWIGMLKNWDSLVKNGRKKVKLRCRKGIPASLRGSAWQYLSGAVYLKQKNVYETLHPQASEEWEYIIRKDIPRTFPYHELFNEEDGPGQQKLLRVLKAFSVYDPKTGYSQALAPVTAVLLMHMPEEEAFWVLVSICHKYLQGYYGVKLETLQLDALIFTQLLRETYPHISIHMTKFRIDPLLYIVEWMMCIFSRSLPFSTVLRVWDIFFCEGVKTLFRVALAMMYSAFPTRKDLRKYSDDYETIHRINNLPLELLHEDTLIPLALDVKLSEKHLQKIHSKELAKRPDLALKK